MLKLEYYGGVRMNVLLLKQICLLSVLVGLATGVLTIVPFIGSIVFMLYFLLVASFLIIYLKKNNILGELTIKEGGVIGAAIGISSFLGVCVTYVPLIIIKQFIFYDFIGKMIASSFTSILTFIGLFFMILFTALLCGLMNCFSGAVTVYIFKILSELNKEQNGEEFKL